MPKLEHFKVTLDAGHIYLRRMSDQSNYRTCEYITYDRESGVITYMTPDLYVHFEQILAKVKLYSPTLIEDTETEVICDIKRRQKSGIEKYKTTVGNSPGGLRYWLNHAYEETLDKAIYLKRAIQEIDHQEQTTKQAQTKKQETK